MGERGRPSLPGFLARTSIRIYQIMVSPWTGRNCRYLPTCSQYAYQAVDRFGLVRGVGLALRRIGRCQPLIPGGYDPVPSRIGESL